MFKKFLIVSIALVMFLLSSCIKDEPLNMEADITAVYLENGNLITDPLVTNNTITIYVKPKGASDPDYKLKFDLTPGATIVANVDPSQNSANSLSYTVTSENKQFQKKYMVSIIEVAEGFVPSEFGFENFRTDEANKYHEFFDVVNGNPFNNWSSGNPGFAISLFGDKNPEMYPTRATDKSRSGKSAALLETRSTGPFGAMFGKPIAAGNLFIGAFDVTMALASPLKATRFGLPYNKVPKTFEGYYRYVPGKQLINSASEPVEGEDECAIYAVFYNIDDLMKETQKSYLSGENVWTSKSGVATAKLESGKATAGEGFTKFSIPFKYTKDVNIDDVNKLKYGIAIVMSASKDGDNFQGAIGSTLVVDDLQIILK
ncbi:MULTISPECIES: PCMD domain-containing protein [unclassified Sphingobacterium]|uniref:PCMD domain-containing protein n=1 Tax=unclassified Sphingobacterium TaxID=2609468 RepID=UPI0025E519EB|nr:MULTISPECIES: PCMD domain-containing protein [unclassified Sphingobacterium]